MADPRDTGGGSRDNRPPDQDTGSLLRDLRSLRETSSPRPGVARPATPTPPPKPAGTPGRFIGVVLLMVVLVVGLAGYNAGVFETGKPVNIGVSPGSPEAPSPSPGSPEASASPSASSTSGLTPPRVSDEPAPLAPGLVPAGLGLDYAVASFLLNRYDPAVKPAERFAQPTSTELLAVSGGPAVWFARDAAAMPDELAVVSSAASAPCTAPDEARRSQVVAALLRLSAQPGNPLERALGQIATGDPRAGAAGLAGSATQAEAAVLLALAEAGTGAPPDQLDRVLAGVSKPSGWSLGLRAHLAVMQDQREPAIAFLTEVSTAATQAGELYLAAGLAVRLGNYRLASGLLERVNTVSPSDQYSLYWRGLVAEKQGRSEEALKRYADALKNCNDPRLMVVARIRRAFLHQRTSNHSVADREWKAAEDWEPSAPGVWLAQAQSLHALAELSRGADRNQRFQEALDRWQRLIVVTGARDDLLAKLLACYGELRDQANAREGIRFLSLLVDFGLLGDAPSKGSVTRTLETLKERIRPRPIWEAPPK